MAQGVDANRLSMLLAILSRHADLSLAEHDVFVNLVGGLEIAETATDLPLALALASSLRTRALPSTLVVYGELGLTGEVRPVAYGEELTPRELEKLGFPRVIPLPRENCPAPGSQASHCWACRASWARPIAAAFAWPPA